MSEPTILDHLEELRRVLWRCLLAVALLLVPGFWLSGLLVERLGKDFCPPDAALHYFAPMEPFLVQLKLGLVISAACALPYMLAQLGSFVSPGLHAHERRFMRWGILGSVFFFLLGAAFCYFLILPMVMRFSYGFAAPGLRPMIGLGAFVELAGMLLLGFGVMFQLPVVMLLLVRLAVVRAATLKKSRPMIVVGIFILAAILTPPDVVSQLCMALPCWVLFELALLAAKRLELRREEEPEPEAPFAAILPEEAGEEERELLPEPDPLPRCYRVDGHLRRAVRPISTPGGARKGARGRKR